MQIADDNMSKLLDEFELEFKDIKGMKQHTYYAVTNKRVLFFSNLRKGRIVLNIFKEECKLHI
jgi:hypothetical protein